MCQFLQGSLRQSAALSHVVLAGHGHLRYRPSSLHWSLLNGSGGLREYFSTHRAALERQGTLGQERPERSLRKEGAMCAPGSNRL